MESAAGQVPPTGEPVAELLARIGRQAALIGEYRDREAAKDAVIEALQERAVAQEARIVALEELVAELLAQARGLDSRNSSKPPSSDGPGTRAERRRDVARAAQIRVGRRPEAGEEPARWSDRSRRTRVWSLGEPRMPQWSRRLSRMSVGPAMPTYTSTRRWCVLSGCKSRTFPRSRLR